VRPGRGISGLLVAIGLAFALLGQFYFAYRREYMWDGVLFWCIAVFSLWLLHRQMTQREQGRSEGGPPAWMSSQHWPRMLAVIGAVWLVLWAGWVARQPERIDFTAPFWAWLVGVCSFVMAFVPRFSIADEWTRLTSWLSSHRCEVVSLAVLLLVALAIRAIDLEHIPANLGGDEGTQGVAALQLLGPPLANPFSTGWFSVPTMSFLAYGASMRIFGQSVAGLRALSALVGTGTVLTTFLLVRELWGRRVAWLATVALTFSHYHIHFSRLGSNQVFDGLCVTLSLWLLVRARRLRQAVYFALAGVVVGLGWYGYFGARLVGIIVICYLAWRLVVEYRFLSRYGWLTVVLLGAVLVVTAPLLLHYVNYPHELTSRARQVSVVASGWLAREQVITGRSAASLLFQQLWRSISAFNYTLDPTFWYHPSIPTLDFVSGGLFVLGLLWTTVRCRWPNNGLLLIWFWLGLGLGWVMTENPPSSQRMIVLVPALATLVGLGLNWLMEWGQLILGLSWGRLAVGLLFVVAILNLRYYFLVYTPTRVYGNPTAEVATELGRYLARQEDNYVVHFHAPPSMYWDFGTLAFMARGVEGVDVPPAGEEEWPEPDPNRGVRFVFLAERRNELDAIRERYPGGREASVHSSSDDRLLYVLYRVDGQQ
jgi:hypothetical protein